MPLAVWTDVHGSLLSVFAHVAHAAVRLSALDALGHLGRVSTL